MVDSVNFNPNVSSVNFRGTVDSNHNADDNTHLLEKDAPEDTFEFQHTHEGKELSKEDKQEIIRQARTRAAGFAILGTPIVTLIYGLRSDKKVAEKYNLDVKQDKALIRQIRNEQMLNTIPGIIPGVGILPALICWLYNRNMDPAKIDIKE